MADPISMSQLSWVMQLFYALHIGAMNAISVAKKANAGRVTRRHPGVSVPRDPAERHQIRP